MILKFRPLRADEVECRIGTAKEGSGVSLLLYKDARCDMNVLDETVGAMNWQKYYSRDNANCTVSIWDEEKSQWISKEDTGTESRTEAEKGLASDSFKRACFNWGIGRELYSAPFIWIKGAGKYDKFWVKEMQVVDRKITRLVIGCCDKYGNRLKDVAYEYPRNESRRQQKAEQETQMDADSPITEVMWKSLQAEFKNAGISLKGALKEWYSFDLEKPTDITIGFLSTIISDLDKAKKQRA